MPKVAGSIAGDFAEVVYWVIRSRFEENGSMTVADINKSLDEIALKHTTHESSNYQILDKKFINKLIAFLQFISTLGDVEQTLQLMLLKLSAIEQKWLIRLLLKDMHLGIAHTKILKTYHPDAVELYDVCNDLTKVINNIMIFLKNPYSVYFANFSGM